MFRKIFSALIHRSDKLMNVPSGYVGRIIGCSEIMKCKEVYVKDRGTLVLLEIGPINKTNVYQIRTSDGEDKTINVYFNAEIKDENDTYNYLFERASADKRTYYECRTYSIKKFHKDTIEFQSVYTNFIKNKLDIAINKFFSNIDSERLVKDNNVSNELSTFIVENFKDSHFNIYDIYFNVES